MVGEVEVEVDLAKVIELVEVHGGEAGIESLDDARAHGSDAAVLAADDTQGGELSPILLEDPRGVVGGPVVNRDDQRRRQGLPAEGVECPAHVLRLIAARRDQYDTA
jgi:hypothetical protein